MFTRYLILALRHFRRSRVTTIINVLGLSIGISAAVIVFLFIQYNFSFDQFEPARGRMYRVEPAPLPLYSQLKQLPAGIEAVTAIVSFDGNPKLSIRSDSTVETLKNQSDVVFTDSTYFRLFPHVWLAGNPEAAMRWPNQLVLSESRLRQYFPGESADAALGKVIIFDDSIRTVVSGIVKDLDVNSDFECKLYISLPTLTQSSSRRDYGWDNWGRSSSWSPVLISLTPKTRPQQVSNEIAEISRAFNPDASRNKKIPQLQALSEVHAIDGNVSPSAIDGLVLLAFVLVLLGAINFINLATAQSTQRAAETGIRKILGSSRRDLILQSLTETVLLMLVTTCLCMELIWAGATKFLPAEFHLGHSVRFITIIGFVLFLSVLVSVVAGLYPAFVLSRFLPVQVLKSQGSGSYPGSQRTAWLRKTLTVSQFVVAQVFLIGVIIVNKQVLYALNKDMGFRRDAIVVMHVPADGNKFLFQHTLRAMPEIQKTSFGEEPPAFSGQVSGSIGYMEKGQITPISVDERSGDSAWLGVYQIGLLAGRRSNGDSSFLINETLCHDLGFAEAGDAIGKTVYINNMPRHISGVMADFDEQSARTTVRPLVFQQDSGAGNFLHVALQPDRATWKTAIAKMQTAWKALYPDEEFNYYFLNDEIRRLYRADELVSALLSSCSVVAIIISCMGLLGLVIFMTNTRSREISIRKILGASGLRIFGMLTTDLLKWIALAFLIAIPISFFGAQAYLQSFSYRTALSWWVFVLGGVIIMIVAFAVVGFRTIRASTANPVNSLRNL